MSAAISSNAEELIHSAYIYMCYNLGDCDFLSGAVSFSFHKEHSGLKMKCNPSGTKSPNGIGNRLQSKRAPIKVLSSI